tara:strand:+ start:321 stop:626 length:306 start_codon:yes stop_codon:yes gene_type:complete
MNYSNHALKRCQQRGISSNVCELLKRYGQFRYSKNAISHFFTDHSLDLIERELGGKFRRLAEKKRNAYLVESLDGTVITVCHRKKRKNTALYKATKGITLQ